MISSMPTSRMPRCEKSVYAVSRMRSLAVGSVGGTAVIVSVIVRQDTNRHTCLSLLDRDVCPSEGSMSPVQSGCRSDEVTDIPLGPDAATARQHPGELVASDRTKRTRARPGASPEAVRVLIADGHALVRAGLRALLEAGQRVTVVAEATTGEEAGAVARRIRPDRGLIDAPLPRLDSVEATARICADAVGAVMLLTGSPGDERIFAALRAGARGLLLEDTEPAELV